MFKKIDSSIKKAFVERMIGSRPKILTMIGFD